ncbi:MAG: adenosylmethionine decarboxylase [Candidatus Micrarchaeota archaeon]
MVKTKTNEPELVLGKHLVAECETSNKKLLNDEKFIMKTLVEAAKHGGFTVLKAECYKFSPQGVTAIVLLSESHISIHTWPEHNYAGLDIFTCGPKDPKKSLKYIQEKFKFTKTTLIEFNRGKDY